MKKKVNISLPKGKKATNLQFKLIDSKIEVSYDVEDAFNPKDGDFLATKSGRVFIYNGRNTIVQYGAYCGIDIYNKIILLNYFSCSWTGKEGCRYATEQEKSAFLERLEKECKQRWNPETKQIEDIRWRAENENIYYYVSTYMSVKQEEDIRTDFDGRLYECGNYFRTSEAAQKVADQIKEIFKKSKVE